MYYSLEQSREVLWACIYALVLGLIAGPFLLHAFLIRFLRWLFFRHSILLWGRYCRLREYKRKQLLTPRQRFRELDLSVKRWTVFICSIIPPSIYMAIKSMPF
jgi:hypothetical protein